MLDRDSLASLRNGAHAPLHVKSGPDDRRIVLALAIAAALIAPGPAAAAQSFSFKTSYRDVAADPDGVWLGKDLAPTSKGVVTIYEYVLAIPNGKLLISQIWNADCAAATCPTRLVRIGADGRSRIIVDDMMRQVIPPDDPRFAGMRASKATAVFAEHPFALSDDGKTLLNGDYKFPIGKDAR